MKIEGQPFEIQIIGEDGKPIDINVNTGYAGLRHGEQYKIRIINNADTRAAISFTIDGIKFQNKLVIPANSNADLETIPDTGKRLTFFAQDMQEAQQALLGEVPREDLGVVSATFTREKKPEPRPMRLSFASTRGVEDCFGGGMEGTKSFGAGGTGLSGHSNQRFGQTTFDTDSKFPSVTINLRLVHDPARTNGLDAHPIPGRQKPVANEVPPPVGGGALTV